MIVGRACSNAASAEGTECDCVIWQPFDEVNNYCSLKSKRLLFYRVNDTHKRAVATTAEIVRTWFHIIHGL
jgi:hypothetical protein